MEGSGFNSTGMLKKNQTHGLRFNPSCLQAYWLFTLLILIPWLTACTSEPTPLMVPSHPVNVIKIATESWKEEMHFTGEVVPETVHQLSFPVTGIIRQITVNREDRITPQQLLGLLDATDYQTALEAAMAQMTAAQANLDSALAGAGLEELHEAELQVYKAEQAAELAENQYRRIVSLFEAGGVSEQELDRAYFETTTASASLQQAIIAYQRLQSGAKKDEIAALTAMRDAARSEVDLAVSQRDRTSLNSEVGGIVREIFYQEGELYASGTPFLLLHSDSFLVRVSVSGEELKQLSIGADARILYNGKSLPGTVTRVAGTPDRLTRTYAVDIILPPGDYLVGSTAQVMMETAEKSGIRIPMGAVLAGEIDYVYVVENHTAVQIPVTIEGLVDTCLWVAGLSEGQLLVTEGMYRLSPGDTVQIMEEVKEP